MRIGDLASSSVMIIGQKKENSKRITWNHLHDASNSYKENDMRNLLSQISQHVIKKRIKSGSARKFLDGKLIYVEVEPTNSIFSTIYCLYTLENNISNKIKKSFNSIIFRSGEYSAKRFFSEMIELLSTEDDMTMTIKPISTENAIELMEKYDVERMDVNHLGRLISMINHSGELNQDILEKIYLVVYETVQRLENNTYGDTDEFLDAAFLTATLYESQVFHLSMELYKKIIPLAVSNNRHNLETACHVQLCKLYREKFPDSGELILLQLNQINDHDLSEISKKNLEELYVIKAHAYFELGQWKLAEYNCVQALKIAENTISSPMTIAEAYSMLASMNYKNFIFNEASRQFLTASAISFSIGELSKSNLYLQNASLPDIYNSLALSMSAITYRMESNHSEAEFKSWLALKQLIKAYIHQSQGEPFQLMDTTEKILAYSESILVVPGKIRQNGKIIRSIRKLIDDLTWFKLDPESEQKAIDKVMQSINNNVPLPPPTFMLLVNDGRLIIMGEVNDNGWVDADIKGVILSGIISAITALISEVSETSSALKTIDAGDFQIMLEQGNNIIIALLVDRELPIFRRRMKTTMNYVNKTYASVLDNGWDGNTAYFGNLIEVIEYTFAPNIISKLL